MSHFAKLLSGTALSCALVINPAAADHPAIDKCRSASSDADRIACLEQVIRDLDNWTKPAPPVVAEREPKPQPVPTPSTDEASIGQEQVTARTRTREEQLASLDQALGLSVALFEYVGYKKLQVRLENGQIWRQIKGDVQEIRTSVDRNPTVDIIESSLGGYKLRLNEIGRTIRVQRVR